uniref:Uncharacterized protein n=1 Tax=Anguilla anguilla TaxID=7936 RepID=A0A0E9SYE7_ANGAN
MPVYQLIKHCYYITRK